MSNRGNTGHRGYKMSRVEGIEPVGGKVVVTLSCGHTQTWEPYHQTTAEAWAAHFQQGHHPITIGKTRLRCEEQHEEPRK